jgi:hypothetical protein
MNKPVAFLRYIDNIRNMPKYIEDNRNMSGRNKMLLDSTAGMAPKSIMMWVEKQYKIYNENGLAINDLSQKHIIASGLVEKYPDLRDKFLSGEANLESINLPVIMTLTILSGGIMTLYDSISFRIKLQNKYLNELEPKLQAYKAGQINETELQAYVNGLKDYVYKPPVNFGGALLIGGLIFGAFYWLTQPQKLKKLLGA